MSELKFSSSLNPLDLPAQARDVLLVALETSHNPSALATSLTRAPADQARIMYFNLEAHGVDAQRELYAAPGRAVIDVYVQCKAVGRDERTTRAAMELKIIALGPATVSRHCADPRTLAVVDIAPSSLANPHYFETAIALLMRQGKVSKFLTPANRDPAYHVEIPLR